MEKIIERLSRFLVGFNVIEGEYKFNGCYRECFIIEKHSRRMSSIEITLYAIFENGKLVVVGGDEMSYGEWFDLDKDELKEYEKELNTLLAGTTELCPHCGEEVTLVAELTKQTCTNCQEKIIACSMCESFECSKCPLVTDK